MTPLRQQPRPRPDIRDEIDALRAGARTNERVDAPAEAGTDVVRVDRRHRRQQRTLDLLVEQQHFDRGHESARASRCWPIRDSALSSSSAVRGCASSSGLPWAPRRLGGCSLGLMPAKAGNAFAQRVQAQQLGLHFTQLGRHGVEVVAHVGVALRAVSVCIPERTMCSRKGRRNCTDSHENSAESEKPLRRRPRSPPGRSGSDDEMRAVASRFETRIICTLQTPPEQRTEKRSVLCPVNSQFSNDSLQTTSCRTTKVPAVDGPMQSCCRIWLRIYGQMLPDRRQSQHAASRLANFKSGTVVIHADNGAVAVKLRQMGPR